MTRMAANLWQLRFGIAVNASQRIRDAALSGNHLVVLVWAYMDRRLRNRLVLSKRQFAELPLLPINFDTSEARDRIPW